jgi:AraC family transcriptional regulator, regulatory protein of adaptative response / methylphosphotriester-DNA alkyltransferase methyltransferase
MFYTTEIKISQRKQEIVDKYVGLVDSHLVELKAGKVDRIKTIQDFASMLFIHPVHLSNTIHEVTGESPCGIFEEKLMTVARDLISNTEQSIASIARHLTYDPSNFGKFFKNYQGITPMQYRKKIQNAEL